MFCITGYGIMGAAIKGCGGCGGKQKSKPKRKSFRPVVISGPSGSGKSTLVRKLMEDHKNCFAFCVSHTTRRPRPGEINGKDYHFVPMDEMIRMIENDEFIEHAKFSGHLYGTSKRALAEVIDSGLICILDIDMMGVRSLKEAKINAFYIFIKPPSIQALKDRLRKRGTEKDEVISHRMLNAVAAVEYAELPGSYDVVIVNDNLDAAYENLKSVLAGEIEELQSRRASIHVKQTT